MTEYSVHINRVRPLLREDPESQEVRSDWTPPLFHHEPPALPDELPQDHAPQPEEFNDRDAPVIRTLASTVIWNLELKGEVCDRLVIVIYN